MERTAAGKVVESKRWGNLLDVDRLSTYPTTTRLLQLFWTNELKIADAV